jgi:uncharacterized protein (DUF488 family)
MQGRVRPTLLRARWRGAAPALGSAPERQEKVRGMTIFTIGHSTRPFEVFLAALEKAGVDCIVDVRRFPRSRRHPHFNAETLARTLPAAGVAYRHMPELGGRRERRQGGASPHTLWRKEPFRNYADYAESEEFRAALASLIGLARNRKVAIMCAEAVWWRCHRRIIADYLLAAGEPVTHILDIGKQEPARLTEGAAPRSDGSILYAAEQPSLPL